ncbi:MAG: hypothetical protein HUJ68_03810 [Clostridia bacterium]|nr:hypothetical protein [Clostridia bacterium]
MKKVNFIAYILLSLSFLGCKSVSQSRIENKEIFSYTNGTVIPFEFRNKYMPCFKIKTSEGVELDFLFDSGMNYNSLYDSGRKKLNIQKEEIFSSAYSYLQKSNPSFSEKQIKTATKNFIDSGNMQFTFNEDFYNTKDVFKYENKNQFEKHADGMVGLDFFNAKHSLVVDYLNKCIVVDGDIIEGTVVSMKKDFYGLYTIDVTINDVSQKAIVDTGSAYIVLAKDYKTGKNYSEKEIESILYDSKKIRTRLNLGANVEIGYGDKVQKKHAYNYYNALLKVSDIGRKVTSVYSTFGYPMFSDKRIQFDFDNSKFIMGDLINRFAK